MIMSKSIKVVSDLLLKRWRNWCVIDVCIVVFAMSVDSDINGVAVLLIWIFFADDAIDSLRNYINIKVGDREVTIID